MRRARVVVDVVDDTGVAATAPLWEDLAAAADSQVQLPAVPELLVRIQARMASSAAAVAGGGPATYRLVSARDEAGELVGIASMRLSDGGPLVAPSAVILDVVHVAPSHRRSGVGRALLVEAARFGSAAGVDELSVHVPNGSRELNRFYAGWGFAPRTLRRSMPIAALCRRLGVESGGVGAELDQVGQLHRLLRRRAVLGGRVPRPARAPR